MTEGGSRRPAGLKEQIVAHAATLPLGDDGALVRVAALCSDPAVTAAGVAAEAARDEAFSALLLKIANSAYSFSWHPISDLTRAVVRLGLSLVQGMAIAAPGMRLLAGPPDELQPARRELHRHAVRVGVVARALAPSDDAGDEALAAGLVHNLGLAVLSVAAPDAFRTLVDAAILGRRFAEVEEETLGFTHAELGAAVAQRWSYPLSLVIAIADHESDEPSSPLAPYVRLADLITRERGIGIEPPEPAALELLDPDGSARARALPLLDSLDRLEASPGELPVAPEVSEALQATARAALY